MKFVFEIKGYRRPVLATRPGLPKGPQVYNQGAKRPRAYRRPQPKQKAEVILEAVETAEAAAALDTDNRRHYDAVAARGESTSLMRSILGVNPFCVHEDAQFSCTFTPLCWMHGGVAMSGCDSMLYSCCVSHTIARRQVSSSFLPSYYFDLMSFFANVLSCASNLVARSLPSAGCTGVWQ